MKPASVGAQESDSTTPRGSGTRAKAIAGEPSTGIVRKVEARARGRAVSRERHEKKDFASGIVRRAPALEAHSEAALDEEKSRAWRCLEWAAVPEKAPPPSEPPAPRVSIAQVTTGGDLVRQSGPDEALPETAGFIHRVATLIAQDLGFRRCRALCLRGPETALSVAQAGATKVVAVTGPVSDMGNVLRRMDLE